MQTDDSHQRTSIRYQPDEKPPLGAYHRTRRLQLAILCIAGVVLTPAIVPPVIRAADRPRKES